MSNVKNQEVTKNQPYVSAQTQMVEFSVLAICIGFFAAFFFSMSNTYLALKVGISIAAGIPSSILGVGLLRMFNKHTILQGNVIQAMGSMSEAVSAGVVFVLAVILLWGLKLSWITALIVIALGGILGIFLTSIFRKFLIVDEDGKELTFPEARAVKEILIHTSEKSSSGFRYLLQGIGVAFLFKFIGQGFGFIKEMLSVNVWVTKIGYNYSPSLVGVGFIIGFRTASYLFAGSILGWFVLVPMIHLFGSHLSEVLPPANTMIANMAADELWKVYVKNIGVGCVTMAGILSLVKILPSMVTSFTYSMKGQLSRKSETLDLTDRSAQDTSMIVVLVLVLLSFLVIWLFPIFKGGFFPAILVIFFALFFGVVSGRTTGLIGSSNDPVSGMTFAGLLVIAEYFRYSGLSAQEAMVQIILLAAILCVAISVSGSYMQSMKVGFWIGGTTKKNNITMFFSVMMCGISSVATLLLLDKAYGINSSAIAAPQAHLMKLVVEGIMGGNLDWSFLLIGAFIAVVFFIMDLPVLSIAVGLYLDISTTFAIWMGGVISSLVSRKYRNNDELLNLSRQHGNIFASGIIAGEALSGILLVAMGMLVSSFSINHKALIDLLPWSNFFLNNGTVSYVITIVLFVLMLSCFVSASRVREKDLEK